MLLQIMPEQVIQFKELIRYAVEDVVPKVQGETRSKLNNVLSRLMLGEMTAWLAYRKLDNGQKHTYGLVITRIVYDDITETKSLFVYFLTTFESIMAEDWLECFQPLRKFGLKHKCYRITGLVDSDTVLTRIKQLGGNGDERFISIPLGGSI